MLIVSNSFNTDYHSYLPEKSNSLNTNELPEEEKEVVEKLKKRDREVRAHEQAHVAAGGSLVRGGPTYEYQYGPDGKRYAIGGHVDIDTSPGKTPEETIRKADQIVSAALAPADPSNKDRAVAAEAKQMKQNAQAELRENQSAEQEQAKKQYASIFNGENINVFA